tara:strand:+ start:249 stop:1241 length:993 start_codon:yes stop_codon:yes gene_type:complete
MHAPHDLEDAIVFGDHAVSKLKRIIIPISSFKIPEKIGVSLHSLYFPSPLIFSSFKSHVDTLEYWLRTGMGGGCLKTITPEKRDGNKRPRICSFIQDDTEVLLNALGLPNPGIDTFLEEASFKRLFSFNRPIGFSIAGETLEDYQSLALRICDYMAAQSIENFYLELNVSCPNVNHNNPTQDLRAFFSMLSTIRKKSEIVLGLKVSPEESNHQLIQYSEMMEALGSGFLSIGNTKYQTKEQLGLSPNVICQEGGGLSGYSLFTRTLEMVQVLSKYPVPLIATGGVSDFHHARALLESGASLVGMATALIQNPYLVPKINTKLAKLKKVHV